MIMPIASYILLIGLYNSARSIAFDKQFLEVLKQNIRDKSSLFLESIGTAEWKKTMDTVVSNLTISNQVNEKRIYSELSGEDIQKHIAEVIKEIKEQSQTKPD